MQPAEVWVSLLLFFALLLVAHVQLMVMMLSDIRSEGICGRGTRFDIADSSRGSKERILTDQNWSIHKLWQRQMTSCNLDSWKHLHLWTLVRKVEKVLQVTF